MWKALLAGLMALAFAGSIASSIPAAAEGDPQLEGGISRFKAALRLTPEQRKHWPRVESALSAMARDGDRQEVADASAQPGIIRRVGNRVGEAASSAASMSRLVAAARPLVNSLDQNQKREALQLARAMGFGSLAARFE